MRKKIRLEYTISNISAMMELCFGDSLRRFPLSNGSKNYFLETFREHNSEKTYKIR